MANTGDKIQLLDKRFPQIKNRCVWLHVCESNSDKTLGSMLTKLFKHVFMRKLNSWNRLKIATNINILRTKYLKRLIEYLNLNFPQRLNRFFTTKTNYKQIIHNFFRFELEGFTEKRNTFFRKFEWFIDNILCLVKFDDLFCFHSSKYLRT